MTGRERIMRAIAGEKTDYTPVWPFVMAFSAKYAGIPYRDFATDYRKLAQAQIKTADDFDLDAVTADSDAYREASACGAVLEFPKDDLPQVVQYAITDKSKFEWKIPDIGKSKRMLDKIAGVEYLKSYYQGEKAVVGWVEAPLQSAGMLYNINEFMMDLCEEPEFVEELLEFTTELGIRFAIAQAEAGADIIGIGDAMASMVSPSFYENYILPCTKKMVQGIREKSDVKLKYHICGNAKHVLPFVEEMGFDLVNIDYKIAAADAFEILEDTICVKGNLDPIELLKEGTPKQVEEEVRALLSLGRKKFILSAGCEVARDTPYENLKAMVYASKAYSGEV